MTELLNNLRAVRAQITTPDRWTKGWFARDQYGNECRSQDSTATCWCIMGAITFVTPRDRKKLAIVKDVLSAHLPTWYCLSDFNDRPTTTHADIIALIDRAIATEEKESV